MATTSTPAWWYVAEVYRFPTTVKWIGPFWNHQAWARSVFDATRRRNLDVTVYLYRYSYEANRWSLVASATARPWEPLS